ncbi:cytochrome P450 [Hypoxylon sp. FL0890]|nr:cytochrome P450 [Hypoxylon sp. FL0890]
MMIGALLACLVVLTISAATGIITLPGFRGKGFPSGPPSLPFIGNLHILPRAGIRLKFLHWAKVYGPIFSLKVGHGTIVVLNSAYHATQLLQKRSLHYSDRPALFVLDQLVFGGDHTMLMNADSRWRLRRKLYFQLMNASKCDSEYFPLIEGEIMQTLKDLSMEPAALMHHPGRLSNSIIMALVFGIRTPKHDTPHYRALHKIMRDLVTLGDTGATPPVDLIPAFKYLPECLWGYWKTRAGQLRKTMLGLYHPLVGRVLERRERHQEMRRATFLDGVLDQQEKLKFTRNELDVMCGNLIEGGTDTISTVLLTFFQAMATHPHIQEHAQEHIDSVVGSERLPCWTDYSQLPYVAAIVKEVLRWRPPGPAGFPHASTKDDIIDGIFIPKGSTVILNIWGIHHDATLYPHPEEFMPSRFQGQTPRRSTDANSRGYQNGDHFAYGAGRRLCPGIHLAERVLFLFVARLLWTYTVAQKLDASGNPIPIDIEPSTAYSEGFIAACNPFEVDFKFRSPERRMRVFAEVAKAEAEVFSTYE